MVATWALMGMGDDTFVWNPGDENDVTEGQPGFDAMLFNGANVTMDVGDVESIDFNALGGADNIVVNYLTGTDVIEVNIKLAAAGGTGDGQPDKVIVNATNGDDAIIVVNNGGSCRFLGSARRSPSPASRRRTTGSSSTVSADEDVIEASGLSGIWLTADGDGCNDRLIGSDGNDVRCWAAAATTC